VIGSLSLAVAGAVPADAALVATVGAAAWAVLAAGATLQLVVNVRRRLHGLPRNVARAEDGGADPAPAEG
jgi:hypothetical protein